ncbi:MAG: UDP-N-acetylglucosamine 2-epimerase [Thermodesulfovibrio sp.]|nr:UDP-N-acetylglucosamine 2-epimerase [Thermodesulfovibrio sp.]
MNTKIKVLAITGIRSEYDILYPILDVLRKDNSFCLKVVACGAHLSEWHGYTINKIIEDGFEIADKIDYLLMTNRDTQRAKGVGILITALSQCVERESPDFLLVVGDREESIATAIVGNYMKVLVAHLGGGDPVYGNADDPIRFAVSKLAHIHFVTAEEYGKNLEKIGEEKFRIYWVGNPAYYNIAKTPYMSLDEISEAIGWDLTDGNYIVLIKHPLSSEKEEAYVQMKTTLQGVQQFSERHNFKVVGIYPNTDPGSYDILRAVEELSNCKNIKFYKTIKREIFVNIMRNAKALVGNSSMGLLEAPYYKLPVVNVGNRQRGRLNAGNVEFVPYDIKYIMESIEKAVFDENYREKVRTLKNPYGDESAPFKIKDILLSIDLKDKRWYVKEKLL